MATFLSVQNESVKLRRNVGQVTIVKHDGRRAGAFQIASCHREPHAPRASVLESGSPLPLLAAGRTGDAGAGGRGTQRPSRFWFEFGITSNFAA